MKTLVLSASLLTGGTNWFYSEYLGTYILFTLIGFIVGAGLGYFFAKMPNFDYMEQTFTLKELLPCMLVWGVILAGMAFLVAHLCVMSWVY